MRRTAPRGGEAFGEGGEVKGAVSFVDLNGVASAEADGGAAGAVEIDELAAAAGGAVGVGGGLVELADVTGPDVDGG